LTQSSASRKSFGAIKGADIVEAKETTLKDIVTTLIFAVYPPKIAI
jgi:hypothetical protein